MNGHKRKNYIRNILPCVFYSALGGVATGLFIFFFKWLAGRVEAASRFLYEAAGGSPLWIALAIAALALLGLAMALLQRGLPESVGGGIPRSEGVLRGLLSFRAMHTLLGTLLGSMIGFFAGLPLGCEGPAVLMGTCIGGICIHFSKNKTAWSTYVMSGSAGAAFAVATGAPLSGILFVLEEVHRRFTPMLVLTVSTSVLSATLTNELLAFACGTQTALWHFPPLEAFVLSDVPYLLLLSVIISLAVFLFNGAIALVSRLSRGLRGRVKPWGTLVFVFVLTGVVGFLLRDAIYSGHHTTEALLERQYTLGMLLLILGVRFVLMALVLDSGATGGSFVPTLAVGAMIGALSAELLVAMGMSAALYDTVILLSMCTFIGGTLGTPLIASVLFIELTGQYMSLFYVALVVFLVYAITELFGHTPFYDVVLQNIEEQENEGKVFCEGSFEMTVSAGAFVVGKTVRDVMWPASAVVRSVRRAGEAQSITGSIGDTVLRVGDTVVLQANYHDEAQLFTTLYGLVGRAEEIRALSS